MSARRTPTGAALVASLLLVASCGPAEDAVGPSADAPAPATDPAPDGTAGASSDFNPMADLFANAPQGRLPDDVAPLAYDVALTVDPRQERFSGEVTIRVRFDAPAEGVWLHGAGLTVQDAELIVPGRDDPIPAVYIEDGDVAGAPTFGVARVSLFEEAPAGEADLRFTFDAPFGDALQGLFRVKAGADWFAFLKAESIEARRVFPSFDEPRFKTPFQIALTVPQADLAVSNAPVVERTPQGDGTERVVFAQTPALPTYLIAVAVGPFEVVTPADIPPSAVRDRPIPLRGLARAGKAADLGPLLESTPAFIATFEELLDAPYPYAKLDIIAAPDWPTGATELAGAPAYREDLVLVGPDPAPAAERRMLMLHAHELAHMWFGDDVTPPWWNDLWLKEAFAVWAEPLVAGAWDPDGGYEMERTADRVRGLRADALESARAVREDIDRNQDIRSAYDAITYSKGPAVLAMVERFLGPERWRAGVRAYIAAHGDGVADAADFYRAMAEGSGEPRLIEALTSFLERPGAPVVEARLDCADPSAPAATLVQSRYRPLGSDIDPDAVWTIPMCVAHGDGEGRGTTCALVDARETRLALDAASCPAWLLPNAEGAGYLRFTLDDGGWAALTDAFDALSPAEALMTLDSATAAFDAGSMSAAALLDVFDAAARAENRHVAMAPAQALGALGPRLFDASAPAGARIAAYVRALYGPRLALLENRTDPDARLFRTDVLAALAEQGGDPAVRGRLAAAAAAYIGMDAPPDPAALDADLYETALTVAVVDGGPETFNRVLAARAEIDDPAFARASARALGAAAAHAQAARARAFALSQSASGRDAVALVAAQMAGAQTRADAWSWLQTNFEQIIAKTPAQMRRRTPAWAAGFCAEDAAAELEALFARHGARAPGHERALRQTVEQIRLCDAVRTARADDFAQAIGSRIERADQEDP